MKGDPVALILTNDRANRAREFLKAAGESQLGSWPYLRMAPQTR